MIKLLSITLGIIYIIHNNPVSTTSQLGGTLTLFVSNVEHGTHSFDLPANANIEYLIKQIQSRFNINRHESQITLNYAGIDLLATHSETALLSDVGICAQSTIELQITPAQTLIFEILLWDRNHALTDGPVHATLAPFKYTINATAPINGGDPAFNTNQLFAIRKKYGHEWKFQENLCKKVREMIIKNYNGLSGELDEFVAISIIYPYVGHLPPPPFRTFSSDRYTFYCPLLYRYNTANGVSILHTVKPTRLRLWNLNATISPQTVVICPLRHPFFLHNYRFEATLQMPLYFNMDVEFKALEPTVRRQRPQRPRYRANNWQADPSCTDDCTIL